MQPQDEIMFADLMIGLSEVFDGQPSAIKTEMYFNALYEFDIAQVKGAIKEIVRSRTFASFPKPGEIRAAIIGSTASKGLESWGVVMECLEQGREPENPKVREALRRIGDWSWLMARDYDELKWIEKRFVEHYESLDEKKMPVLIDGKVVELLEGVTKGRSLK